MIKKFCIIICWLVIIVCIVSIFIVIATGGINLFSIGDFHVYIRGIRRPTGFLVLFSILILFLKKRSLKLVLIELENRCAEKNALLLLGIFILLFIWIKIVQHIAFKTGFDLACFDQSIFNTLKGNFMHTSMVNGNFFGEHFSPILLFFVPLYFVYSSPIVFLVIQALATAFSGYFIYKLARLELKNNLFAIVLMISYLGSKYLMNGFLFDTHVEMLEPLFIIGGFYFLKIGKKLWYWVFIIFALMCKEDVPLYIFTLGLYLLIFEKTFKIGIYTCILSIVWFFSALKIIIPLCHSGPGYISYFLSRWSEFGDTYREVAINIIKNPKFLLLKLLSKPSINLFFSVLFLPLLCLRMLILIIPPILLNLISNFKIQANLLAHYSVPIVPFLWISAIYGLKRIRYKGISIIIISLLCMINFGHCRFYNIDRHMLIGHRIIKMIPGDVPVSSQYCFIPHISYRKDIYLFPKVKDAGYIFVDMNQGYWPLSSKRDFYRELKRYSNWEILLERDGYRLLKR